MNDLANYYELRSTIRPGDVLSYKGKGLISWLILRIDKRSHVSGIASSPTIHEERCLIIEADQGEVNVRALSAKLRDYRGEVYLHRLKPELDAYRNGIDSFYWAHIGLGYDYPDLFGNAAALLTGNPNNGRVRADSDKYFCSELCGEAIRCGIPEATLKGYLPHEDLERLLCGIALRPGGISRLPIFQPAVRVL